MPDGDRFEWKFRGKGWRKVFRVMCAGASINTAAACAVKGLSAFYRQNSDTDYAAFIRVIEDHSSRPTLPLIRPESPVSGASQLTADLNRLVTEHNYSEASQLCARAAQKTYLAMEEGSPVSERFGADLAWEIVERKCIGIGRDEVVRRRGVSLTEQLQSEQELRAEVEKHGARFAKQLSERPRTVYRAPAFPKQQAEGAELLNRPLPISPEAK